MYFLGGPESSSVVLLEQGATLSPFWVGKYVHTTGNGLTQLYHLYFQKLKKKYSKVQRVIKSSNKCYVPITQNWSFLTLFSLYVLLSPGGSRRRWDPAIQSWMPGLRGHLLPSLASPWRCSMVLGKEEDIAFLSSYSFLHPPEAHTGSSGEAGSRFIGVIASTQNMSFLHLNLVFFPPFCSVSCIYYWTLLALDKASEGTLGLRYLLYVQFVKQMDLFPSSGEKSPVQLGPALALVKGHLSPFLVSSFSPGSLLLPD